MKNRVRRMLAAALTVTAAAVATSCGALGLGGGSYELEIRPTGNVTAQLQSLYVIVAPKTELQEPLLSPSKYKDLLNETRMRNYVFWIQYQPVEGSTWKVLSPGREHVYVEKKVDGGSLKIKVDNKLVKKAGMTEYAAVVLGFFGASGFDQVTIPTPDLGAKKKQVLEVGGGSLQLRDA